MVILLVDLCAVSVAAESATQCTVEQKDNSIVLSNGLCRIVWDKTDEGWGARYQAKVHAGWETVAQDDTESDAAYGVCFKDGKRKDYGYTSGPGEFYKALPPATIGPEVLKETKDEIQIRWIFDILDRDNKKWPVKSVYRIRRGDGHIHEEVRFSAGQDRPVRFQRGWAVRDIDVSIFETIVNGVSHSGWMKDKASFMAIVDPGPLGPTETGHGGGFVRLCQGFAARTGGYYSATGEDTWYSVLHRVPHFLGDIG